MVKYYYFYQSSDSITRSRRPAKRPDKDISIPARAALGASEVNINNGTFIIVVTALKRPISPIDRSIIASTESNILSAKSYERTSLPRLS